MSIFISIENYALECLFFFLRAAIKQTIKLIFNVSVCSGAEGDTEHLLATYKKLSQCSAATRETQLGLFISRRTPKLIDEESGHAYTRSYYKLLIYELLYLWNALPSCSTEALRSILVGAFLTMKKLFSSFISS